MSDSLVERSLRLRVHADSPTLFDDIEAMVLSQLTSREAPIRFAVTKSQEDVWDCDLGTHIGGNLPDSIFRFRKRDEESTSNFNVVMLVPTGIGANIGGHAGDATPAAALLANVCDTLVTHPNVLNASDMIQIPENILYVEGSVITRMMMGAARLIPIRANRLLVLIQSHEDQLFTDAAVNAVNAARAYYGLQVAEVVTIDPQFKMIPEYSPSGIAAGRVEGLSCLWEALDARRGHFDALAISSVIDAPLEFHKDYYQLEGQMINPWGGVEAILTHAISLKYEVPVAHSPMMESREISELDLGVVDPRMAAEVVSMTFLQSVLRGLQRSPRIAGNESTVKDAIGVEGISCLVIPDGCVGLPALAALHQGIPVIAVRENSNIMQNDLSLLPWKNDQLITVDNYWEATGVLVSMRMGLAPYSVRRPLGRVSVAAATRVVREAAPVAHH